MKCDEVCCNEENDHVTRCGNHNIPMHIPRCVCVSTFVLVGEACLPEYMFLVALKFLCVYGQRVPLVLSLCLCLTIMIASLFVFVCLFLQFVCMNFFSLKSSIYSGSFFLQKKKKHYSSFPDGSRFSSQCCWRRISLV